MILHRALCRGLSAQNNVEHYYNETRDTNEETVHSFNSQHFNTKEKKKKQTAWKNISLVFMSDRPMLISENMSPSSVYVENCCDAIQIDY